MLRTYRPSSPLADHVAFYWYGDLPVPAGDAIERVLPNGCLQLVVNLRGQPMRVFDRDDPSRCVVGPSAILTGPSDQFSLISAADTATTVGVAFKPGGAAAFIGMPSAHLFDQDADLNAVWGRSFAAEVHERVLSARDPEAMAQVLDAVLLRRYEARHARHPAVTWAVRELRRRPTSTPVADVVAEIGMSHRRFVALFHETVGLTPKRFSRLQRFQAVLRGTTSADERTWADLAAACGYSDQAHLAHDFRAFAGLTPTEYLRRRTSFTNHVTEEDASAIFYKTGSAGAGDAAACAGGGHNR